MGNDLKMYFYLRKYLSPMETLDLVKRYYPKFKLSIQDLENMRLRSKFKVRYV